MLRKIHLDFHTSPETEGIGKGFDPELFAETMAAAHVNYVATPGKCHYGHVYYDAQVAIPHPHLEDRSMFPRTVEACLKRGIKTQAYWTLGLDATWAQKKPEWRQTYEDGTKADWGVYQHMCFASPYVEEVVIPEILECLERCPGIVGFWFDISLYVDGAFYSGGFNKSAEERLGEHCDDESARWELARKIIRERCIQIDEAIKAVLPDAENFFNTLVNPSESENLGLVHLNEIENPIQFHGPEKMSAYIRWLRGQGVPSIGLVSRFQGPWSDPGTLRTDDQMMFDVARTVALGCDISMGDHRYPDGHLEPEAYRRIGKAYKPVVALESLLESASPLTELLLVGSVERGNGLLSPEFSPLTKHASRVLEELGLQFDMATLADPWPEADCILLLGEEAVTPEIRERLEAHVAKGGALLALDHAIDGAEALLPAEPVAWEASSEAAVGNMGSIGHVSSVACDAGAAGPAGHFIRFDAEVGGEDFPYLVSTPARILRAGEGSTVLAWRHLPVSAKPPFASFDAHSPLVIQRDRVIYCSPNLMAEALEVGSPQPAGMLKAMLSRLIPNVLVEHDAGPTVSAHLHETPEGRLLHLVHWSMDRWEKQVNSSTRFPTLAEITVSICCEAEVKQVRCRIGEGELSFTQKGCHVTFTLPRLHIWEVVELRMASRAE
ncbi:MAG: alpha-amylase family protein [Planctomycetota bacterium]|jgi:hypothetical protein